MDSSEEEKANYLKMVHILQFLRLNVRESALFRAGAQLQQCLKSYLQEMCAWLSYIKCVIGVIPHHICIVPFLNCVFSLSFCRSFYTRRIKGKFLSEKPLRIWALPVLWGVGGQSLSGWFWAFFVHVDMFMLKWTFSCFFLGETFLPQANL